jgi:ammonium transporter, Amt family
MAPNTAQDVWLLVCTGLVFFMQPGFLCLEAGAVRRRNAVNVAMKNFVVELVSTIAFLVLGYGLMFGDSIQGLVGPANPLLAHVPDRELFKFLFQAVFCGTAATIVSGAVAERLRFLPFVLESFLLCAILYPLFGHWAWGNGWLSALGYKDFAGSSVVHLMGAGIALSGVLVLGPRQGRFDTNGKAVEIPASDLVISSLGTFILVFGWIGFNGGSAPFGDHTALIVANTLVAACFGGVATMLTSWATTGVSNISLILNGTLGGLVAITSCADIVPFPASPVVGILAGIAVHLSTAAFEKLRVDDAVGALPVHGVCGILGILLAPLLATDAALAEHAASLGQTPDRLAWLGVQGIGLLACLGVSVGGGYLVWRLVGLATRLRVSPEGEIAGMNFSEHRLADPVAEMSAALARPRLENIDLSAVRGTEFEPLARTLNAILESARRREAETVRWKNDVQEAGARLDQTRREAHERQERIFRTLGEVAARLTSIVDFSRSGRRNPSADPAVALLGDLAEELRRSIEASAPDRAGLESLWTRVEELARRLAEATSRMETNLGREGNRA